MCFLRLIICTLFFLLEFCTSLVKPTIATGIRG